MSNYTYDSDLENKLIIMYLIDKMDLPLSYTHISDFVLQSKFFDTFTLSEALSEMVEINYLDKNHENNNTYYSLTVDASEALELFEKNIPQFIRNKIIDYVMEKRNEVKRDYEVTANYFYDYSNNEFIIKCGLYEEDKMLLEMNISVVNRDQAKLICRNWKQNINEIYGMTINTLIKPKDEEESILNDNQTEDSSTEDSTIENK